MANIDWQNQKENIQQSTLNAKMELADINKKANTYFDNYLKSVGLYGSGAGAGVYNDMQTNLMNATSQINQQEQNQLNNARQDRTSQMQSMIQSALQAGATNEDIDNITSRYAEDSLTPGAMSGVENLKTINDIQQRTKAEAEQKAKDEEDRAFLYQAYQQALANNASAEELQSIRDQYNNIGADERKLTTLEQLQEAANNKTASDEAKANEEAQKEKDRTTFLNAYAEALTNGTAKDLEAIKAQYPELADELQKDVNVLTILADVDKAKTEREKAERESEAKETAIQTLAGKIAEMAQMYGYTRDEIDAQTDEVQEIFNDDSLTPTEKYIKSIGVIYGTTDNGTGNLSPKGVDYGTVKKQVEEGGQVVTKNVFPDTTTRRTTLKSMVNDAINDTNTVKGEIKIASAEMDKLGHFGDPTGCTLFVLQNAQNVFTNDELMDMYEEYYNAYVNPSASDKEKTRHLLETAQTAAKEGKVEDGVTIAPAYTSRGTGCAFTYYDGNWYVADVRGQHHFDAVFNEDDLTKVTGYVSTQPVKGTSSSNSTTTPTTTNSTSTGTTSSSTSTSKSSTSNMSTGIIPTNVPTSAYTKSSIKRGTKR